MQLSRVERWILANQYHILEKLSGDPKERDHYHRAREVLENGWELEYERAADDIARDDSVMTVQECEEVRNILDLYRALLWSYERLEDKAGIDERMVEFPGFDNNTEPKQLVYWDYLYKDDRWQELGKPRDSHVPLLRRRYPRMLAEWWRSSDKWNLSKKDIERILEAGYGG